MQKFKSKRDTWIIAVLWGAIIMLSGSIISVFDQLSLFYCVTMMFCIGFILWVMYGTYYVVEGDRLTVRSGPFKYVISISQIQKVMPTQDLTSSPAMSLDRLRITYGSPEKQLLVSPENKELFITALNLKN